VHRNRTMDGASGVKFAALRSRVNKRSIRRLVEDKEQDPQK